MIVSVAASGAVFLLVASAAWHIAASMQDELLLSRQQRVDEQMRGVRTGLRNALATRLQALAESDAMMRPDAPLGEADFRRQLHDLQATVAGLRELRVVRNGRVTHAFPADTRSAPIPANAAQSPGAGGPTQAVLGPLEAVGGGSGGIILRQATATRDGVRLVLAVFDFEALLAEAGIFDQFPDIEIALRGSDGLGADGEVFYGHLGMFYSDSLFADIDLPNGNWQLAVLPREGWGHAAEFGRAVRTTGSILALLAALAVLLTMHGRGRLAWLRPALLALVTLTTFSALLWLAAQRQHETARQELIRDTQRAQFSLRALLRNDLDYLGLLARAANEALTVASFSRRTASYLASHPEVDTIAWLDPQQQTLAAAEGTTSGFVRETSNGAARVAFQTRRAAYGPSYVGVGGERYFDVWLPLLREHQLRGWVMARYRLQQLLEKVITADMRARYAAVVVNDSGTTLAALDDGERDAGTALQHQVALDPPGYSMALRLSRYAGESLDPLMLGLGALSAALAIGLFWATWRLQRTKLTLQEAVTQRTTSLAEANRDLTQEIAERKRAQQELHGSRERFRRLVEGLSTSYVFSQNTQGVFTYISPSVTRILGYAPADSLTHYAQYFSRHADNQRAIRHAEASLRGVSQQPFEARLQHRDGHEVVLEISQHPVHDERGTLLAVEGIATDVSARKRAESELERYRDRLQDLVEHRTSSLELLNQELESFSYSVSHDLRAPLRAIDGFSKALEEDYGQQLDASAHEHLTRIRTASQRMSRLIDALLKLSRLTRQKMNPRDLDLSTLVREVAEVFRDESPEREVRLIVHDGARVHADPELLRVALSNLIGNAWKFTARQPEPVIEFGVTDTEHGRTFFVRDNGAGFESRYAAEIFTSFKRLHSKADFDGSGIGLATVARIIRRHNGKVWAQGEPDAGATFYFTLAVDAALARDEPAMRSLTAAS